MDTDMISWAPRIGPGDPTFNFNLALHLASAYHFIWLKPVGSGEQAFNVKFQTSSVFTASLS